MKMEWRKNYFYCIILFICITKVKGISIRLSGGNSTEGRVEVYYNNAWGTICDDVFDTNNNGASVVCRMLKLSWFGEFKSNYRNGNGAIVLDDISCKGGEINIEECRHNPWGQHNCGHGEDVGVSCTDQKPFVRLRGGSNSYEGIYEVYLPETHRWYSFCSDGFDNNEARVICRSLNFSPSNARVVMETDSGMSSDSVYKQQFNCNGNEQNLIKCNYVSQSVCNSGKTKMISCGIPHIRLVHGNQANEGKVEIQYNGQWGDICSTGVDPSDAKVLCRMLGHTNVRVAETYRHNVSSGSTKHLENLDCHGDEQDINMCHNVQYGSSCTRGHSLGLKCYSTMVRLASGPSPYEGRLEVYNNGSWGTVCDDNFNNNNARVVCQMIGANTSSATFIGSAYFGPGKGKIWMDSVSCTGSEKDIQQCRFDGWGKTDCSHGEDVSINCYKDFEVRLVNGNSESQGRIEVKQNGQWGALRSIFFTPYMADEFCRYLGFNRSENIFDSKKFGRSSYSYVWNLENLFPSEHQYLPYTNVYRDDVGISCETTELRLTNGNAIGNGRVEVKYKGQWGAICCQGMSGVNADVICRQLGYSRHLSYTTYSQYGTTHNKPMWVNNLKCTGKEKDISACKSDPWSENSCGESCNIGVVCETTKTRLVNGSAPFQGRVEFYHNNEWGSMYSTNTNGAYTVCKMLGYNSSDVTRVLYGNDMAFGIGSKQILSSVSCSDKWSDISKCLRDSNVNWTSQSYSYTSTEVRCLLNARLVDGPTSNMGRVEIQRNNVWGSLCSSNMTDQLATEICKMIAPLPFTWHMTGKIMPNTFYGKSSGPIWGLKSGCTSDIANCLLPSDVGKDCGNSEAISIFCIPNMDTRLSGGSHEGEGRIELRYNNEWVGLCDVGMSSTVASTICRSIGYWKNTATERIDSWFGQSTNQLWYLNPSCSNEVNLGSCGGSYYYGYTHCAQSDEAGVSCSPTNLGRDHIRLVNGLSPGKGELQVEVFPGKWGSVCWQFWNDAANDVVCRTLQFRYNAQNNYTSYPVHLRSSPFFISSFNCTGNETDIGMCKGYFHVYKCSADAVAVDCSGGMDVRLQNGSNPFEGRVEVFVDGKWQTVCEKHFDSYDAKTICSSIGVVDATPTVLSNSYFGEGTSSYSLNDVGCSGWEGHIGQCNIQNGGTCSGSEAAAVKCINCYGEYYSSNQQISEYKSSSYDCIFVIKPPTKDQPYLLEIGKTYENYRDIKVKEGVTGPLLSHITYYPGDGKIVGKEFYIRYKNTNYGTYTLSWRPLQVADAIKLSCDSNSWDVTVNMTVLRALYPDTIRELIYLNQPTCTGIWKQDTLHFTQKYSECNSVRQDRSNTIFYSNKLMYPESKTPNPVIIRNYRWNIDLDCEIDKVNNVNVNLHPNEIQQTTYRNHINQHQVTGHLSSSGKETITLKFFKDPNFVDQINGNPVDVHIGDKVYVKVSSNADSNYKMRLHSCIAKPLSYSTVNYPLIKDGCAIDSTTQIISQTQAETKFSFEMFEFQTRKDNLYIVCNATFCLTSNNNAACNQACHTKRSILPLSEDIFKDSVKSPLFIINERARQKRSLHENNSSGIQHVVSISTLSLCISVFIAILSLNKS